jgi:hypothetical protein
VENIILLLLIGSEYSAVCLFTALTSEILYLPIFQDDRNADMVHVVIAGRLWNLASAIVDFPESFQALWSFQALHFIKTCDVLLSPLVSFSVNNQFTKLGD